MVLRVFRGILVTVFSLATLPVAGLPAPEQDRVLPYKVWKAQQESNALNEFARLANRRQLLKNAGKLTESPSSLSATELKQIENHIDSARQKIDFSRELTVEEYLDVYLRRFAQDEKALHEAVEVLSKDEVLVLLQQYLKAASKVALDDDARSPLEVVPRGRAQLVKKRQAAL